MTVTTPPGATEPGLWCCELELSGGDGARGVTDPLPAHGSARVLVRLHGEPLGYLRAPLVDLRVDADAVRRQAWAGYGDRLRRHLGDEGLASGDGLRPARATARCPNAATSQVPVTVVVCTRDRTDVLDACLSRLAALEHPALELLVVDNAPSTGATRALVEARAATDPRFRYAVEPRPGLSCARNRGLAEAGGQVVAYTDDDVAVDPGWVAGLLRGFTRHPQAHCVTGLVCTASVTSAAEAYFDARAASWSSRVEPEVFDLGEHRRPELLYPYSPGVFGTGASFAFDRDVLRALGGFDEALGAGTLTRGGEDLDVFLRVLLGGGAIVYEPAAVVWHHHRADDSALLRQMYGYGTGLSAVLAKCLLSPATRGDVLRRVPQGLRKMAAIRGDTRSRLDPVVQPPAGALRHELAGFATGPLLYARAVRAAR